MARPKSRSHLYVRWIFLRIVSICFLAAFWSIAVQMLGLYGEHGILPIKPALTQLHDQLGTVPPQILLSNFFKLARVVPCSVFMFNASDNCLQLVCWSGVLISLLAFLGIFTGPMLAILWLLYLSIMSVGQDFMGFQWDALLLETALLAVWFAPWGFREIHPFRKALFESQKEVSYLFLWLLRLLCFKLMMFSGICKIASLGEPNDPNTWRSLAAMGYHYETQPLPTPLAYFTHKLPAIFQQFSTLLALGVELVLPAALLAFWRPARLVAAVGFILLMLVIMVNGNYAFFNLLTIGLAITLLDDDAIFAVLPRSMKILYRPPSRRVKHLLWNSAISLFPAILFGMTAVGYLWIMVDHYRNDQISAPPFLVFPVVLTEPLHSFNSYGLFAHMTVSRPEIIIEGSNDGKTWLPYEFKYKPGDIHRAPPIVAPHQPRLDWQMWFAALGPVQQSPWFDHFIKALLEGSPQVLALMDKNPFPQKPPAQIRATLYDYHFSDLGTLLNKGEWWRRSRTGEFYPPTSLEDLSFSGSR